MIKRIDFGARIAGDKARKPDEFIVKSQLVTPNGEALEVLDNGDIVVPVAASVLPPGLEDQTFRHNGTDWEANDKILSSATVTTITTDHVNVNSTTEYGPPGSTFHVPLLNIDVANEEAVTAQVGGLSLRNYFDDTVTVQNDRMAFDSQAGSIVTTMENRPLENRKSYTHVIECNGVELERLEYDSTQPSVNTVTFNGEIVSKELAGIGDRYIGAADNGAIKIMPTPEGGGGLPNGTEEGQTVKWDGSEWLPTSLLRFLWDSNDEITNLQVGDGETEINLDAYAYLRAWYGAFFGNGTEGYRTNISGGGIGLQTNNGDNSPVYLYINAEESQTIPIFGASMNRYLNPGTQWLYKIFEIDINGMIFSRHLTGTGNRPLYADSSGNIKAQTGATGTFTSQDGKTVTVTNGIITSIV